MTVLPRGQLSAWNDSNTRDSFTYLVFDPLSKSFMIYLDEGAFNKGKSLGNIIEEVVSEELGP